MPWPSSLGVEFHTIEGFLKAVKKTFSPRQVVNQYMGEIGNLKQKSNETIMQYACRTREIETALVDAIKTEYPNNSDQIINKIEADLLKNFIDGTAHFIRTELRTSGCQDLTDAIADAIAIETSITPNPPNLSYNRNTHPTESRTAQITRSEAGTELTYAIQQETSLCKLSNTTSSKVLSYNVLPFEPVKFTSGGFLTYSKPRITGYVRVLNREIPKILLKKQELTPKTYPNDAKNAVTITSSAFSLQRDKEKTDINVCNDTDNAVVMTISTPSIRPLEETTALEVGKYEYGQATIGVDDLKNKTIMRQKLSENLGNKEFSAIRSVNTTSVIDKSENKGIKELNNKVNQINRLNNNTLVVNEQEKVEIELEKRNIGEEKNRKEVSNKEINNNYKNTEREKEMGNEEINDECKIEERFKKVCKGIMKVRTITI
ncbi:hypothetical protein M0802_015247 [Mischocyttarus mexicanus]|nr:hypothetical protein M0802_015247 [Mischocyttarus mexicanus]